MLSFLKHKLIYGDLETDNFAFVYTENVIIEQYWQDPATATDPGRILWLELLLVVKSVFVSNISSPDCSALNSLLITTLLWPTNSNSTAQLNANNRQISTQPTLHFINNLLFQTFKLYMVPSLAFPIIIQNVFLNVEWLKLSCNFLSF